MVERYFWITLQKLCNKREGIKNHLIHHFQTQTYSTICQDCKLLMSHEEQVMQVTVHWNWEKQIKCAFREITKTVLSCNDVILLIMENIL